MNYEAPSLEVVGATTDLTLEPGSVPHIGDSGGN